MNSAVLTFLIVIAALAPSLAIGQSPAKSEIADVHTAVRTNSPNQFPRINAPRGGRYELRNATMVDLVRTASGFDADKILGGPSWLEVDRYDVIIQVPANATADSANSILQSVLADRFRLVTHKDSKPLPTWTLLPGKKVLMKEGDGSGDTGCKPHSEADSNAPGVGRLMTMGPDGKVTVMTMGPGQMLEYNCRNMTMDALAAATRTMVGASLGTNPVLDQTEIKGAWNFDLKYSLNFVGMGGNGTDPRISFPDAVEKQLGLKLEQRPWPTPVLIVDSVEEKPTPNPAGVTEALPPLKVPTEFEVVDIKITDPGTTFGRIQNQPGGRYSSSGMSLSSIVNNALMAPSNDQIVGMPGWADSLRYDITAKATVEPGMNLDPETTSPLLIAMLKDRFGLKYHTEEKTLPAYSLISAKPRMKKADPASRTSCKRANATGGAAGSVTMTCQNATMAYFAEQLRGAGQGINVVPLDATGIEGGWDFTLTWNQRAGMNFGPVRPAEGAPAGDTATVSDPSGGLSIFEALDKQLGLKMEAQKRPMPVFVIDHLEQKPTDN